MTRTDLIRLYAMFECQRVPYSKDVAQAVKVATERVDAILSLVHEQIPVSRDSGVPKSVSLPILGTVGEKKPKPSKKSRGGAGQV